MLYTVNSNKEIVSISPEQVINANIELATKLVNKHIADKSILQRIKGLEADLAGTIESNRKAEDSIRTEIKKLKEQLPNPSNEMDQV